MGFESWRRFEEEKKTPEFLKSPVVQGFVALTAGAVVGLILPNGALAQGPTVDFKGQKVKLQEMLNTPLNDLFLSLENMTKAEFLEKLSQEYGIKEDVLEQCFKNKVPLWECNTGVQETTEEKWNSDALLERFDTIKKAKEKFEQGEN